MTTASSRRVLATSTPDDSGVERDADGVPTAIRLWRAGDNPTDYGVHRLTTESVRRLLAEQDRRGNRYSFDVNHASLDKTAPLENQRAVGSFAIAERGGELWAVACRFSADMRGQLAAGAFLSISPAYDVAADGTIVGLTNCALTSNPATHNATRIAATRPEVMPVRASALDPRLEALRATYGLGASRPLVRNEGCRQVFDYPDPERLRAHARVIASRPAPKFLTPEGRAMHARMVQASRTIRNEGREQILPVLTPEEARAVLAKGGRR